MDIICVDPNPKNYDDEIATVKIQPLFSSTQELCEKFPEMKGNCSVMLIRPQTSGSTDLTNYDIEAIHLLEPLVILVLYGADGSDGSCALHDFLSLHGCPSFSKSDTSDSTFAGFPRYWSRTIRFTEICQPPTMVRVSTCALLIRDDSGLTFPDNIIEGEQNPNAPGDADVARLLKESYAYTAMRVLGGENTELIRLFLEMMGNEEIK